MKFNLIVLAGLFIIAALPLGSSLVYKQNELIDLKIPCSLDGYPCSSSAMCNLTIQYPNASYLVDTKQMTNLGTGDFNYTLYFIPIGDYPSKVACLDKGVNKTSQFIITITPSGVLDTSGFYWIVLLTGVIFMVLGIVVLVDPWITLLGTIGLYFVGIQFFRYGIANRLDTVVIALASVILGVAMYISTKTILEVMQENYG